jgi:hypothetical protein
MRSFPAAFVSVLLVFPLFICALTVVGISTWALDKSFYTGILSDVRLYQIPDAGSAASRVRIDLPDKPGVSLRVSARALKQIISPQYMRSQALSALASVFDFLEGKTQVPDPILDLAPIKKALRGSEGQRFALALVQDMPVGGQASEFAVSPGRLPESRPPSLSVEKAAAIVAAGLPAFAGAIPNSVRLSDYAGWDGHEARMWGWRGFPALRGLIIADVILLALAAAFWVAAAFIGGVTARQRLQWLGWSLLAPAAAVFLVGLFASLTLLSSWMRGGIASARLESLGFDPGFGLAVADAARAVMGRIGTTFLAAGAIAAGVSLALLGASWSLPKGGPLHEN